MSHKKSILGALFALSFIGSITLSVAGKDFAHKTNLNQRSKSLGMSQNEVKLLKIKEGRGRSIVTQELLDYFSDPAGAISTNVNQKTVVDTETDYTSIAGDGWSMFVYDDGTKAEYRNEVYIEKNKNKMKAFGKIADQRLEVIGKQFIHKHLNRHIKLKNNEKLVPFHTFYDIDGMATAGENDYQEVVVGNTVVFSRTVDGIDVVGPGSKISIMFANDETPVAFRFDWPEYETTDLYQTVVEYEVLKERMSAYSQMRMNAKDVQIARMECGYLTSAIESRDSEAYIQAACYVFYQGNIYSGGEYQPVALVDIIPAGEIVEVDFSWPESERINEFGEVCQETDVTDIVFDELTSGTCQ